MRLRLFLVLAGMVLAARPGWAGDGKLALQTGASSCRNQTTNIYVNCGNGTVTDNRTGLVWLRNANCIGRAGGGGGTPPGRVIWFEARDFVAGLSDKPAQSAAAAHDCGLSDGSSPGEWRLPSVEELEAMVAEADALGCKPRITNDSGNDCWDTACVTAGACSFSGVMSYYYWSGSFFVDSPGNFWAVSVLNPWVVEAWTGNEFYVWPVRGGQ